MERITRSEMELLNVLWRAGRALTRGEILALSKDKTWKDNSVHVLLNGMLGKGIIREAGFARSGKVWGRCYAPTVTAEEYYAEQLRIGALPSPVKLVEAMLRAELLTPEDIRELEAILEDATGGRGDDHGTGRGIEYDC